ncbi:ATP-dependent DNA helicase [Adlercreutzia sp. ZJ304]|uniref:ATP-dependent helicase n=1 Tax=Adlercreutzia sp. ZJ304 TaxID=2709791 RepID=UPI0013ED3060|nr:ATP-dependent DNA helicase [Adlercreutzia sp. ZJ304]
MFDFGNANNSQIKAITTTDGPLLIIAGPGTGKTYTLVTRVVYLITEKHVDPKQIMVVTFTEKAAKELITRISNKLTELDIQINPEDMYIGTFHSVCMRIISENIEYSTLKKNYRIIDDFDQQYLVFRNFWRFRQLPHFEALPASRGVWDQSAEIPKWANNLSEELIDANALLEDDDDSIKAIAEAVSLYNELLEDNNWLDFAKIQYECYRMLQDNPGLLSEVRNRISYVMVDEYQDTNYIQEQFALMLSADNENLCVVGDDDQGLYRFRGATIRNIIQFPSQFKNCEVVHLDVNYRSRPEIVGFYDHWMTKTEGRKFKFDWAGFRHEKHLRAVRSKVSDASIVSVIGGEDSDWSEHLINLVRELKESGKIEDYNQVAFLFKSVKSDRVRGLAEDFATAGINVYSPRSNEFFDREEIKLALGLMLFLFPGLLVKVVDRKFEYIDEQYLSYLDGCIEAANSYIATDEARELRAYVSRRGKEHHTLSENADHGFLDLIYELFAFEPFRTILDTDTRAGVYDLRPLHNLSLLTSVFARYEYLHHVSFLSPKYLEKELDRLFDMYLKFMWRGGIGEFEDETEYVPSGCVSFMTIHQSKGMEFPVVVVDTTNATPRKNSQAEFIQGIIDVYGKRAEFEPTEDIKYFDFWRLYYTAFSRAQDVLVVTTAAKPTKCFEAAFEELPACEPHALTASRELQVSAIKEQNLKAMLSFTSHIAVYEGCSLQYKFHNELEFTYGSNAYTLFGSVVHQTIEDMHKAALRGEADTITPENMDAWFNANYETLSKSEHAYLAEPQKEAARKQVARYMENQRGRWDFIREAEVPVSLVKPDYIIVGKIDLVRGEGDTVELVDFKAERKPDMYKGADKLKRYREQLQMYAHLIEEKTDYKVSKLHVYFTGEENGVPTVSYPKDEVSIARTVETFDEVAHKALAKDYSTKAKDYKLCKNCDFRHYCSR